MKISATINLKEYDFNILPSIENDSFWIGKKESDPTTYISFKEDNGIVIDLYVHKDIVTKKDIILERILEQLKEIQDTRQMGFENDENSQEKITKPYDPEQIRVRPMVLSAFQINRDIDKNKIDLNPDFQRNFVWNDIQKSRLIESMLLKIPLPAFYFAEDKKGNYQVIDGLQRLTVINHYMNNKFCLRNLEYLQNLEGRFYSLDGSEKINKDNALYEPYDSRIETTQLNINVIEAASPIKVKYDIFYRINTGGRPLNNQEIRNCFASNKVRKLLKTMAISNQFRTATDYSINDIRMDAQELSLRFLGFLFYRESYIGEMNGFLNTTSEKLNELEPSKLKIGEEKYYKSLNLAYHLFGKYAFRKCLPDQLNPLARKQFLNKAMFLVWTILLSNVKESAVMQKPKKEFARILAERLKSDDNLFYSLSTGTTDRTKLDYFFLEFDNLLKKYLRN